MIRWNPNYHQFVQQSLTRLKVTDENLTLRGHLRVDISTIKLSIKGNSDWRWGSRKPTSGGFLGEVSNVTVYRPKVGILKRSVAIMRNAIENILNSNVDICDVP